jgi:ParB-like chromosome segregation protein Spo0J
VQIERIPINKLRAAPYNPRRALRPGDAAWERLARSLDEFDLVQPLVWNRRTGHLVGGHQRLEILKERGVMEVECVVVDLPPEREKALNVALNNPAVAGDWEPDRLVSLIEELQDLPDFDATLTGFSEEELRDLRLSPMEEHEPDETEQADNEEQSDMVLATLEVPPERWEAVQERLDELLEAEPEVAVHVRMPEK